MKPKRVASDPFLYSDELVVLVPLSRGKNAIVDARNKGLVSGVDWSYHSSGYAYNDSLKLLMHQLILPCDDGYEPDHRNRNGLDNRISNLRPATRSQNNMNAGLRKDNRSGVRGVSWCSTFGKWIARICVDKK